MKTIILKLSGKALSAFIQNEKWSSILSGLYKQYDGIILVHGAGNMISDWSTKLDCDVKFVNGQRVTTAEIMDIVAAVQAGLLNQKIISYLHAKGLEAIGLSGIDRNLFVADYLDEKLGFVGYPKLTGNISWVKNLLKEKVIPVFSSVCRDSKGNLMNVNADVFCEVLAASIKADTVLFISDVAGVMLNGVVKSSLDEKEIDFGIAEGEITGGMIPKVQSCVELLQKGINKIWIGDDVELHPSTIPQGGITTKMKGTWITANGTA